MPVNWTQPIDIYCERLDPSFWAEPANAVSNIAFVLAAIWGWSEAQKRGEGNPFIWVLIALAALIGVGSFLFHTFAMRWSEYADVVPIWSFVALYVFVATHRLGGIRPGRVIAVALIAAAALTVVYLATMGADVQDHHTVGPARDPLNGSGQYLPAVIAFVVFGLVTWRRRHPMRHWIAAAGGVFVLSLTARTFDMRICGAMPLGLHFIWHLLNGLMIGLLLQVLIRSPRPA